MKRKCRKRLEKFFIFGSGSAVLVIGLILGLLLPIVTRKAFNKRLQLRNPSLTYNYWIETHIPRYFDIYLFNWTNSDELGSQNFKPKFTEYGPLIFSEKRKPVDLVWNKNHTLSYNQIKEWHFESTLSNCTLSEPITQLNIVTTTIAHLSKERNVAVKKIINHLFKFKNASLITTKSANELIFQGYSDQVLNFLKELNTKEIKLPVKKFGWLVGRNVSKEFYGRYEINTGTDKINKLGYINRWNGADRTKFYEGHCSMINGTTDEILPPTMKKMNKLSIFISDLCRTIDIYPVGNHQHYNINGIIWKASKSTLDNGKLFNDNFCYCQDQNPEKCPLSGVIDTEKCYWNSPILLSFPHFYLADLNLVNAVEGIEPHKEKHEFFLTLETTSGVLMNMSAKFQINLMLQHNEEIDLFENVTKNVIMPMLWINQRFELDEEHSKKFKIALTSSFIYIAIGYSLIGIGCFILTVGAILTVVRETN